MTNQSGRKTKFNLTKTQYTSIVNSRRKKGRNKKHCLKIYKLNANTITKTQHNSMTNQSRRKTKSNLTKTQYTSTIKKEMEE